MISKYVRLLRGKTSSSPTETDTNTVTNRSEPEVNDMSTSGWGMTTQITASDVTDYDMFRKVL